jgi:hypothetical protein
MPLDDNFDAATVARDSEVYRSWADDTGSAFETEEYARRHNIFKDVHSGDIRVRRNSESLLIRNKEQIGSDATDRGKTRVGGSSDRGVLGRMKSDTSQGSTELVEHRVLEDGPTRTITVWREQVASTSEDNVTRIDVETQPRRHGHMRTLSGNGSQGLESLRSRDLENRDIGRNGRSSLERNVGRLHLTNVRGTDTSHSCLGLLCRERLGKARIDWRRPGVSAQ